MAENHLKNKDVTISKLYPSLREDQLIEAEENLRDYLSLTLRIYERVSSDPMQFEKLKALTRELDQLNNS